MMAAEDLVTVVTFLAVVIIGIGYQVVRTMLAGSPRARIRQRLMANVADVVPVAVVEDDGAESIRHKKRMGADSPAMKVLMGLKAQVDHMGGTSGLRIIVGMAVVAVATEWALVSLAKLDPWLAVTLAPVAAGLGGWFGFTIMVRRYRTRFVASFPDALDLMIRAVRAGVPVVHAIMTAGRELPYPVGREFRIMGDSLRLGMDQQDVLDAASKRIGVSDFRFFVVCLQLQRETGGPLADTLENLSNIIRARREVQLKTRALTAQGRAASKIIAMVPVFVVVSLDTVGGDYMDVLFNTETGQHLLWLAAGMVLLGLFIIARMSKLED